MFLCFTNERHVLEGVHSNLLGGFGNFLNTIDFGFLQFGKETFNSNFLKF